jgi:hypothetical protein
MGSRKPNFFDILMSLCFIAFECFYMMYLMHFNDLYGFDSIEPNSKKHRNIEKIRFGSRVLEFHCIHFYFIEKNKSKLSKSNRNVFREDVTFFKKIFNLLLSIYFFICKSDFFPLALLTFKDLWY